MPRRKKCPLFWDHSCADFASQSPPATTDGAAMVEHEGRSRVRVNLGAFIVPFDRQA